MLKAAVRALSQLADPALFGVLIVSVLSAGLILVASWVGIAGFLDHVRLFQTGWLDWLARLTAGAGAFFATLALFGALAATIAGLFIDRVAGAVERRYYPDLPRARPQKLSEQLALGLSLLVAMAVLNFLALPVYLIWGANLPVFLALNGYLLGRAYFELVALRHMDGIAVARLRKAHPFRIASAGAVIAALSLAPFANLLTPVLATAFMVHIFQNLPELRRGLPPLPFR